MKSINNNSMVQEPKVHDDTMSLAQAQEKFNKAKKVVCLATGKPTFVVPGTVKKGENPSFITMVVSTNEKVKAIVVDNEHRTRAKILSNSK